MSAICFIAELWLGESLTLAQVQEPGCVMGPTTGVLFIVK